MENGIVVFSENLENPGKFEGLYLNGSKGGRWELLKDSLQLCADEADSLYGAYNSTAISGHFYIEVDIKGHNGVGLALVAKKGEEPDIGNFTAIYMFNEGSNIRVKVRDRQNGEDNILDNTGVANKHNCMHRYDVTLDGRYSMPYKKTTGKLRIFRNANTGFFHYYVSVGNIISGEWTEGWLELGPSKDWNVDGTEFFAVPFVCGSEFGNCTEIKRLYAINKPMDDKCDMNTGFLAEKREYNWGGYFGEAAVVTFGKHLPFFGKDYKFVFWDQANYEPFWHIDNNTAFSYEHVESWDSNGLQGCFEPMSDRFKRWSRVEILENNSVRKRILWHHVLVNPDYEILGSDKNPDDLYSIGNYTGQLPEVDEYYTFYPDGTIVRHIVFTPKLDGVWENRIELGEWMVLTNGKEKNFPSEHVPDSVVSFTSVEGEKLDFTKADLDVLWNNCLKGITPFNEQYCKPVLEKWNQLLAVQHLNSVDAYGVFNNELTEEFINGGTTPGILTSVEISWHNMEHHFGHWPVNLEHWWVINESSGEPNYHATTALWPEMVTHTSSCGIESWYENKWESHYKTNEVGRKYREWVSLIGLSEPNDYEAMRNNTAAWLKPGNVKLLDQECVFRGVNYREKVLEFEAVGNGQCCFSIKPEISMVNPCIRIKNRDSIPAGIYIDGLELKKEVDFEAEVVMGDILIWINKTFKNEAVIEIL